LPVRGLAIALVLGVVLAASVVGIFSFLPASFDLSAATQYGSSSNQTKTNGSGQPSPGTSFNNSTYVPSTATTGLNAGSNSVPIGDIASAVSGLPAPPASNSTASAGASGNSSQGVDTYGEQKAAVAAVVSRDLFLFAAAGALALGAFLFARRRSF